MSTRVYGNPAVPDHSKPRSIKDELFNCLAHQPELWQLRGDNLRQELQRICSNMYSHGRQMPDGRIVWLPKKAECDNAIIEAISYIDRYRDTFTFEGGRLCLK